MNITERIKLSNGCRLEKAEEPGQYYYYKPGVLVNLITKNAAERLAEPIRSEVLEGIDKLEKIPANR